MYFSLPSIINTNRTQNLTVILQSIQNIRAIRSLLKVTGYKLEQTEEDFYFRQKHHQHPLTELTPSPPQGVTEDFLHRRAKQT